MPQAILNPDGGVQYIATESMMLYRRVVLVMRLPQRLQSLQSLGQLICELQLHQSCTRNVLGTAGGYEALGLPVDDQWILQGD